MLTLYRGHNDTTDRFDPDLLVVWTAHGGQEREIRPAELEIRRTIASGGHGETRSDTHVQCPVVFASAAKGVGLPSLDHIWRWLSFARWTRLRTPELLPHCLPTLIPMDRN
jgi:hypothetical protein